jgi:hypothetical protein
VIKRLETITHQREDLDTPGNEDLIEDIKEGLAEIDLKLKEIEELNNRNYKVDDWYLE